MTNSLRRYLLAYIVAAVVFCFCDFVWLTLLATDFYRAQLGPLMLAQPKLIPAAAFYVLYLFGLLVFAIAPALRTRQWQQAMRLSTLLGAVAYGTYDLSNLATLQGWSASLTVVDILWGAVASAVAGTAGYAAGRLIKDADA